MNMDSGFYNSKKTFLHIFVHMCQILINRMMVFTSLTSYLLENCSFLTLKYELDEPVAS